MGDLPVCKLCGEYPKFYAFDGTVYYHCVKKFADNRCPNSRTSFTHEQWNKLMSAPGGEAVAERSPKAPGGINWLCETLPERGAKLYLHPAPALTSGEAVAYQFWCPSSKKWCNFIDDQHRRLTAEAGYLIRALYGHPAPAVDDGVLRDAERYRWLRSKNVGPSQIEKVSDDYSPPYFTLKCESELDDAIDAAMKEQQDAKL